MAVGPVWSLALTLEVVGFFVPSGHGTLLKMCRYYSTTMCHYWHMSVK